MAQLTAWTGPRQFLRRFLLDDRRPTTGLLSAQPLLAAIAAEVGPTADRIFTPVVTLEMFLVQILSADHSCQAAVERLAAARVADGQPPCATDTGGYCKARQRLPLRLFQRLAGMTGQALQQHAPAGTFHGRPVTIVDGTGCSMPDTADNRRSFGQPGGQRPGVGFPMARVLFLVGWGCAAVLEAVVGACQGKQTGECAALRRLHGRFQAGAILLGDRLYGTFFDIALLARRGVDVIFGVQARRHRDYRRGRRLGRLDHLVAWAKPPKPAWMGQPEYDALPATMTVRELRVRIDRPGFRTRAVDLVTTLVDPAEFPGAELAGLARSRWHVELDIRSLKQSLAMDVLRCRSAEMVSKEIWGHLLAYNLVRTAMAAAAERAGLAPRRLGFQGARQTLREFAVMLGSARDEQFEGLVAVVVRRLADYRVGHRAGRHEPRARKRRPKKSKYLQVPRAEARTLESLAG